VDNIILMKIFYTEKDLFHELACIGFCKFEVIGDYSFKEFSSIEIFSHKNNFTFLFSLKCSNKLNYLLMIEFVEQFYFLHDLLLLFLLYNLHVFCRVAYLIPSILYLEDDTKSPFAKLLANFILLMVYIRVE